MFDILINYLSIYLKQPTFRDATTGFHAKWRLRNKRRNSMLMTCHYPELGIKCFWLVEAARPINHPDLCSDASSVWNFCARFSDVISREPVVASRNVGCFLMLTFNPRFLFVLQRVDQMWSMFNQYVKTRTQDNFKFWIVSLCCSSSNFQPSSCFCLFVCFFSLPDARLCW